MAAAAVVWGAGTRLTRSLDAIAARTGMSRAFAGMLFLGSVTSLPEIANVVTAAAFDHPKLAINNLLGASALVLVQLAVADALTGRDAVTSVIAKPSTLMMAALAMLMLVVVAMAITAGDVLLFGAVGAWAIAICALAVAGFWLAAGYDRRAPWLARDHGAAGTAAEEAEDAGPQAPLAALLARAAAAAALLVAAGYTLSQTGDALAAQTGLGSSMTGFALISAATSQPEFSTVVAALRIRRYEMAFGDVLGSIFVNLSMILLADAIYAGGPVLDQLGAFETLSALLGAALSGVYLIGLLERRNPTVLRMGYDSLAVLLIFAAGLALLYARR
nr:sodium:calcium antiporter [Caldovatus aquaticus]